MASLNSTINISGSEYRPCITKGRKALFHKWSDKSHVVEPSLMAGGHNGGVLKYTVGIIEYEDGVVTECYPHEIRFCDSKFQEYYFPEQEGERGRESRATHIQVR